MANIGRWQAADPSRYWDPFGEMESMRASFSPSVEVKETRDAFMFDADVPGLKEGDVDISVVGNRLTFSGKRDEEQRQEDDRYYAYERSYGAFTRTFTLPESADLEHIEAHMSSGVLHVKVPKKPEVQPRKVTIGSQAAPAKPRAA